MIASCNRTQASITLACDCITPKAAMVAGCDMVLVCNNQPAAIQVIDTLKVEPHPLAQVRLMRMRAAPNDKSYAGLREDGYWRESSAQIAALENALAS